MHKKLIFILLVVLLTFFISACAPKFTEAYWYEKKYFVFSDVHGYYSLLISRLKELGFDENNTNHMLISLGDNFDRGCENLKMYDFLKTMKEKNRIILVKGNHEDLLLKILYRGYATDIDDRNGTTKTLHEFISRYFDEDPKTFFMYNSREV